MSSTQERPETAAPTVGFGNKNNRALWFSAKGGKFSYSSFDQATSEKTKHQCDHVHGILSAIEIRWKEPSGEIAGHEELTITLGGRDENGEEMSLKVCTHYPSTCARMWVGYLPETQAGDHVAISVWGSKENDKVTFGKVQRVVGGQDVAINRRTDAPKYDKANETRALSMITAGPAKEKRRRELLDEYNVVQDKWMREIVEAHPCFVASDAPPDEDPYSDEAEAREAAMAGTSRTPVVDGLAEAPEGPAVPGSFGGAKGLSALGVEIPADMVPSAATCRISLTLDQVVQLESFLDSKGVALADYVPVVSAILRDVGEPDEELARLERLGDASLGVMRLVATVLRGKEKGSLGALIAHERAARFAHQRKGQQNSAADEYDPFADL